MNEYEFEITPGELLPPETRIPLPEMSYEQELLNTPVPFENRVEFLSDYVRLDVKRKPAKDIAVNLGISIEQVISYAQIVGAEQSHDDTVYDMYTEEVIADELAWEVSFSELDAYLSSKRISQYLGRGVHWVEQQAYGLGVYPIERLMPSGRKARAYPKGTAWMLRHIMFHTPPANDMYSIEEARKLVGKSRDWIEKQVESRNLPFSWRMSAVNHDISRHITGLVLEELQKLVRGLAPPAGNWMTDQRIASLLERDEDWVTLRANKMPHASKRLLDDSQVERLHRSPEVFLALKRESEENRKIPFVTPDVLSVKALAKRLGRSERWVRNRSTLIKDFAQDRRTLQGRPGVFYSENAINILEAAESRQTKRQSPPQAN